MVNMTISLPSPLRNQNCMLEELEYMGKVSAFECCFAEAKLDTWDPQLPPSTWLIWICLMKL